MERFAHIHGFDYFAQATVALHSLNLDQVEYVKWEYLQSSDPPVRVDVFMCSGRELHFDGAMALELAEKMGAMGVTVNGMTRSLRKERGL